MLFIAQGFCCAITVFLELLGACIFYSHVPIQNPVCRRVLFPPEPTHQNLFHTPSNFKLKFHYWNNKLIWRATDNGPQKVLTKITLLCVNGFSITKGIHFLFIEFFGQLLLPFFLMYACYFPSPSINGTLTVRVIATNDFMLCLIHLWNRLLSWKTCGDAVVMQQLTLNNACTI